MSTNRTYIIMKNGVKIKTTRSLNSAKAFANQEQAEVFCNGEKVYQANQFAAETQQPVTTEEQSATGAETTDTAVNVPEAQPIAYRIKALMNVRKAPSLNAERIAVVETGKIVNVYEIKDNWLKVKWYEGFAYILYKDGEFAEPARG